MQDYFRRYYYYFRAGSGGVPPAPVGLLSLRPFIAVTATGRPWQPQTLMLSLRSSSPSSAVSKSRPSHKGKLLLYNRPRHDVRSCGLMVKDVPPAELQKWRGRRRPPAPLCESRSGVGSQNLKRSDPTLETLWF